MPVDTTSDRIEILEDFDLDNINTTAANGVRWLVSSDSCDTAFAATAVSGNPMAQGALAATDNNLIEIAHALLAWRAQEGVLGMEARLGVSASTTVAINLGFNDDQLDDSNTLPVELCGTSFTSNAATFVGLVFDTDATNDDWHAFWVDDNNDTTQAIANLRFTAFSPNACGATNFNTYFVELEDQGSGNGAYLTLGGVNKCGSGFRKTFTSTVDRDANLTPYVGVEARACAARTVNLDYVKIWKSRL